MLQLEVIARPFILLSTNYTLAQSRKVTHRDFAITLLFAFIPTAMAACAIAPAPAMRKIEAKNPFGLSDDAYKDVIQYYTLNAASRARAVH